MLLDTCVNLHSFNLLQASLQLLVKCSYFLMEQLLYCRIGSLIGLWTYVMYYLNAECIRIAINENAHSLIHFTPSETSIYKIIKPTRPDEMRTYLSKHPCPSKTNNADLIQKFDALIESPTTKQYALELYKYCHLYNTGGVYLDEDTKFLVEMQDVLNWSSNNKLNYAVVSDSADSGVETMYESVDIALPVTKAASFQGGDDVTTGGTMASSVITAPLLAVASEENAVMKKMLELIVETSVKRLEEEALLLPKALMKYVREEEEKWKFFGQRCHGVEVAGGEER